MKPRKPTRASRAKSLAAVLRPRRDAMTAVLVRVCAGYTVAQVKAALALADAEVEGGRLYARARFLRGNPSTADDYPDALAMIDANRRRTLDALRRAEEAWAR